MKGERKKMPVKISLENLGHLADYFAHHLSLVKSQSAKVELLMLKDIIEALWCYWNYKEDQKIAEDLEYYEKIYIGVISKERLGKGRVK